MPDAATRAQKTTDKTVRGGLPAPVDAAPRVGVGGGAPCGGCGEAIAPTEQLYAVKLFGALTLDFHVECYESWTMSKPGSAKTDWQ